MTHEEFYKINCNFEKWIKYNFIEQYYIYIAL